MSHVHNLRGPLPTVRIHINLNPGQDTREQTVTLTHETILEEEATLDEASKTEWVAAVARRQIVLPYRRLRKVVPRLRKKRFLLSDYNNCKP